MAAQPRLLIMLGSGPGIGVGVASHFASQSFDRIALLSRNAERLQQDVASVKAAAAQAGRNNVTVKAYAADVGDTKSLESALDSIVKELGKPEVIVYNAARLGGSELLELSEERVEGDWKVRLDVLRPTPQRDQTALYIRKSEV